MNISFNTINDAKFSFIEEVALRNAILKSGRKNIFFVEGYDDKIIFEIIFSEHSEVLSFIDVSLEESKRTIDKNISAEGGCGRVKKILSKCVSGISQEKRFYGVIDRDLKTDEKIEEERVEPHYDGRLFIFTERYTIENYFVTLDVLHEFIKRQSISHKALIPLSVLSKADFQVKILEPIESCLAGIGAANLTIHDFDNSISFLEWTVDSTQIENRVIQKLSTFPKQDVIERLNSFKNFIAESPYNIHKFASAKVYISYNFRLAIEKYCSVSIQINNHKSELAGILKEKGLPNDFENILLFLKLV